MVEPLTVLNGIWGMALEVLEAELVEVVAGLTPAISSIVGSNSLIRGKDFILDLEPLVAEAMPTGVPGDNVVANKGDVPEMNWLKPERSKEWVL